MLRLVDAAALQIRTSAVARNRRTERSERLLIQRVEESTDDAAVHGVACKDTPAKGVFGPLQGQEGCGASTPSHQAS